MKKQSGWIGRLLVEAENLLFPEQVTCLCCDRALDEEGQDGVCTACMQALDRLQMESAAKSISVQIEGISRIHAAYPYDAQAKRLVRMLKYESVRSAAIPLAHAMALLPSGGADIIVPVPTDRERLKKRGFNQADVLAGIVGRETGIPVVHALVRTQSRAPQSLLSAAQRRTNLAGCMQAGEAVNGMSVLLIDDVVTTGSTLAEAARALMQSGAAQITALAATYAGERDIGDAEPFPLLYAYKKRGFSSKIHGNL